MNKEFQIFLKERIGTLKLIFNFKGKKPVLTRVYLPGNFCDEKKSIVKIKAEKELLKSSRREINLIKKYIKSGLSGKKFKIEFRLFDFSGSTEFEKKVLKALFKYSGCGKTITYKRLGEVAGYKNTARAVGNAMAKNPFPIIFPCHKVVCSDGSTGKFQGGSHLKIKLLKATVQSKFIK